MRLQSWGITALLYALTTLSMATVGVLVPFMAHLSFILHASPAQIGIAIACFSLPSAILATVGGAVIDAVGVRRAIVVSGLYAMCGDALACAAPSIAPFDLALLLCGVAFAGISVAAPAMIVEAMAGAPQIRAMSFWSTYAPTGYAMGLLMTVPFLAGDGWKAAMLVHGVLMAIGTASAMALPSPVRRPAAAAPRARLSLRGLGAIFRDGPTLRLGIAVALPNGISYGTSLVAPTYLARAHDVGLAASSTTVALAKIFAMIVGGVVTGQLLARQINPRRLFLALAGLGCIAQVLLYAPASSFAVAAGALIVWLFAFGGMAGGAMAQLPLVVGDRAHTGLASGLIGQLISVASFCAPPLYFGLTNWVGYCAVALVGLLVSAWAIPAVAPRKA